MKDIFYCSALELGAMVNRGEIKPTEILDAYEKRIAEINPKINAIVYTKFDEAKERAREIEEKLVKHQYVGPFAGVPVGLKDFLPSKTGWTASHGGVKCLVTADEYDSEICKAMEKLGAIVIGKTNAPSFGFRATTDNKMYGPTSTPFNTEYNSGGSSGGSASAVSAGLMAIAEGGDAGGSIRCPAAWCGCFGFKPSAGLVPSVCRPDAWTATHPYCCGGPITRTVDDAANVLSAMIKYDPRDPISVPTPPDMIRNIISRVPAMQSTSLKIGYTFDFDIFPEPEPEIKSAIIHVVDTLKNAGHTVDEVKFNFKSTKQEMEEAWLRGICIDTAVDCELDKQKGFDLIGDHAEDLPGAFIKWNDIAIKSTMLDYRKFHEVRTDILDAHLNIFDNYDIILAPVTGCMPVKNSDDFDTEGPSVISGVEVDPLIGFSYTFLENMIGTPAASIPVGLGNNNLPIGLQVIGNRYCDDKVFAICRKIEELMPWQGHYQELFK